MEPVTHDRCWQEMVNRLANQARRDTRRHKHEAIGRVLYAVVFSAIISALAVVTFQYFGWIK